MEKLSSGWGKGWEKAVSDRGVGKFSHRDKNGGGEGANMKVWGAAFLTKATANAGAVLGIQCETMTGTCMVPKAGTYWNCMNIALF